MPNPDPTTAQNKKAVPKNSEIYLVNFIFRYILIFFLNKSHGKF